MVRKKIDNRIRVLIENGVALGRRTMFVIVGERGRDQVVILHHMLSKATIKARPNVLWCYKKELGFSSHRKKKMKNLQKKIKSGKLNVNEDDPFELFVASTNIRYCYYTETHKILGNTFGMCILQDFEALTPNILARTIETVEGGGLIILLLRSVTSLRQLYTMTMDVHERFRTEAHSEVVARFNERFLLSLVSCPRCLVMDDQLTVLPLFSHNLHVEAVDRTDLDKPDPALISIKESLEDLKPVGVLVKLCKTADQAKAVLKFVEAISDKTLRSTVSLTASRGRGKSAALGIAMSAAVAFGYSNIFVTSPSPENLNTLFEFVFKGFDALEYQEHLDYDLIQSTNPEFNKAIVRVNIFRDHRQTIQYIHPTDAHKLGQAELVVIDEAAAIPLPYVKAMLGPYLMFLSSTVNGYEGTGRSLSLKLLSQLRTQAAPAGVTADKAKSASTGRGLHEVTLEESIRYKPGDAVEEWLTSLLCLDATTVQSIQSGCPPPESCDLYYINRDTLFCFHEASESFLQRIVSLFVASHYKNSPNDLQMMSDAPAHHLFCLLGPVDPEQKHLPEVLVVIQVCLEGQVSKNSVVDGLSRGRRAHGDLIPWTIAQQFQDQDFPMLTGARILRTRVNIPVCSMGYGSRALMLLKHYYELKIPCISEDNPPEDHIESISAEEVGLLEERIVPRKNLPPLLLKLSERRPEQLHYLGVAYGLTLPLIKFWKRAGFVPVYLRQTTNDLTGEHSCIMLQQLDMMGSEDAAAGGKWLPEFFADFRRRFLSLLGYQFRNFLPALALSVLQNKACKLPTRGLHPAHSDMFCLLLPTALKRGSNFSSMLSQFHVIFTLLSRTCGIYVKARRAPRSLPSYIQGKLSLARYLQKKILLECGEELSIGQNTNSQCTRSMFKQLLNCLNRCLNELHKQGISLDNLNSLFYQHLEFTLLMDLMPALARLYFLNLMGDMHLSAVQAVQDVGCEWTFPSRPINSQWGSYEENEVATAVVETLQNVPQDMYVVKHF
ncbi:hypothetical protein PR048_000314 [Dryococelus australis]|uniref:RNA cytidine acetyltransferase n=1 Tax=Dryococelus australis TaxID=614101 RepID=A0ABQ9IEB1_9NEOP|nr:hypothetical protein PR048_000314 [Dryococelus australis]